MDFFLERLDIQLLQLLKLITVGRNTVTESKNSFRVFNRQICPVNLFF